jgi:hypothetical protein
LSRQVGIPRVQIPAPTTITLIPDFGGMAPSATIGIEVMAVIFPSSLFDVLALFTVESTFSESRGGTWMFPACLYSSMANHGAQTAYNDRLFISWWG